jgi:alpha-L-fucosidase
MQYAVLTAKHHDGFCLWPSRYTEYCVRNSPGQPDVVGLYAEAFRAAGLKVGLYYSLWDRNYPYYEDDEIYAAYMRDQISELLTGYGDILELWFDGGWDKDHPTRQWAFDPAWETVKASRVLSRRALGVAAVVPAYPQLAAGLSGGQEFQQRLARRCALPPGRYPHQRAF